MNKRTLMAIKKTVYILFVLREIGVETSILDLK